jgi:hypothetical protein
MVTTDVPCVLIGDLLLLVNVFFLSALMYTAAVLHHGGDYYEQLNVSYSFTYKS